MTFGYLNCSLCRSPLEHGALEEKLAPHRDLRDRAFDVALKKFQDDGFREQFEELDRPITEEEIIAEAVAVMVVFQCCDCKEPFCAGRMDCAEAAMLDETHAKPMQCPTCEWTSSARRNDHRCMIHGHKYAMFKCDSCCAVATWNCYSNHYCERCHNEAHMAKHYPCPGPEKCPLGMPHPPNVEAKHVKDEMASFCIGCTACLGCNEIQEDLRFNDQNVFGFPERQWMKFTNGNEVLKELGEEEVRARLKFLEPHSGADQDALDVAHCAAWLLSVILLRDILPVSERDLLECRRIVSEDMQEHQRWQREKRWMEECFGDIRQMEEERQEVLRVFRSDSNPHAKLALFKTLLESAQFPELWYDMEFQLETDCQSRLAKDEQADLVEEVIAKSNLDDCVMFKALREQSRAKGIRCQLMGKLARRQHKEKHLTQKSRHNATSNVKRRSSEFHPPQRQKGGRHRLCILACDTVDTFDDIC
jgi:hypothetical protein